MDEEPDKLVELFFRHATANRVDADIHVENVAGQRAIKVSGSVHGWRRR